MPRTYAITTPEGKELTVDWWENREPTEKDLEAINTQFQRQSAQAPAPPGQQVEAQPPTFLDRVKEEILSLGRPSAWSQSMQTLAQQSQDPLTAFNIALGAVPLAGLGKLISTPKRLIETARGAKAIEAAQAAQAPVTETLVGRTAEALRQVAPEALPKGGITLPIKPVTQLTESEKFKARAIKPAEVNQPEVLDSLNNLLNTQREQFKAAGRLMPEEQLRLKLQQPQIEVVSENFIRLKGQKNYYPPKDLMKISTFGGKGPREDAYKYLVNHPEEVPLLEAMRDKFIQRRINEGNLIQEGNYLALHRVESYMGRENPILSYVDSGNLSTLDPKVASYFKTEKVPIDEIIYAHTHGSEAGEYFRINRPLIPQPISITEHLSAKFLPQYKAPWGGKFEPPPPPPEPPDITDMLKENIPTVNPPNFLKRQVKGTRELFDSPYVILFEDPTGRGEQIWRLTDQALRKKSVAASSFRKEFISNVKIAPDSPSDIKLGTYLDRYDSWERIPAIEQASFTPEEKQTFLWMRDHWNKRADILESEKLLMPDRRLKSYFFRIFDKDDIYNAWTKELEQVKGKMFAKSLDKEASAKLKDVYDRLTKSIDTYKKTGTLIYDYLPTEFTAPFLKPRAGAPGYQLSAIKSMNTYEYYFNRQLYDKEAIKQSVDLMKDMSPYYKKYANDYLRRYAGIDKGSPLKELEHVATNLVLLNTMGFNPRNALVNATQHLNTIAEIGPTYTVKGAYKALFDDEARAAWDASGHGVEVPGLYYGQVAKGWSKVNQAAMKLYDKVELGNRMTAWIGARAQALDQGLSAEAANRIGDDVLRKTQFIYGPTGSPMIVGKPFGSVAMQFTSFPIKQLELFTDWAKNDPAKLIKYLIIANGTREGMKELGIDLSNALGIGIDEDQLFRAFWSVSQGKYSEAWIHTKLGLPKVPLLPFENRGSGVFPSGFAPVLSYLQDAINGEYENLLQTQGKRTYQSVAALIEGQTTSPLGKKGYPVRSVFDKTLTHLETPLQLATRTFLARPSVESGVAPLRETVFSLITKGDIPPERGEKAFLMNKMLDELRREKTIKAARLALNNNVEEANKIVTKYGLDPATIESGVESEYFKQNFTAEERLKLKVWTNKGRLLQRYQMGIPPNMP